MDNLINLSHHAYCISGNEITADKIVFILKDKHGIEGLNNQDFFYLKYQNFTIDDARKLKSIHEIRPIIDNGKKFFIIVTDSINFEAQNALLKLFEEPAPYAHFFIVISSLNILLPTIKSRLFILEDSKEDYFIKDNIRLEAKSFVESNLSKRLELVKKIIDDVVKENKRKEDIVIFIGYVQKYIREIVGIKEGKHSLLATETVLKYINDRSSSLKILLEYLALSI